MFKNFKINNFLLHLNSPDILQGFVVELVVKLIIRFAIITRLVNAMINFCCKTFLNQCIN